MAQDTVWSARDTTPADIEEALRRLLKERHGEDAGFVPGRALNLICVVERDWAGEVVNRLDRTGRFHPSRTIILQVERGRRTLDAVATMASEVDPKPGEFSLVRETVMIRVGERHVAHLDSIVDPLVVTDLPTLLWSPHGHDDAVENLLGLAQVVLLDSVDEPDERDALHRSTHFAAERGVYVVDLAWLRTTPWRERVAALVRPPPPPPGAPAAHDGRDPPPRALALGGAAPGRLAGLAAGLEDGGARLARRRPARPRPGPAPGRDAAARGRPDARRPAASPASRSRPRPAGSSRSTAAPGACARATGTAAATPASGPSWAPRAASQGSSARGSVKLSCVTRPTSRR